MDLDVLRELAEPILLRNRGEYEFAVDEITAGFERRNPSSSAALVQVAAEYAWRNHPGVFSSPILEKTLMQLALIPARVSHRALFPARHQMSSGARARKVLHVLSEAYREGGHTRLVARWIRLEQDSEHSLAILHQPGSSIPEFLRQAVSQSGGVCYRVDQRPTSLLGRAKALGNISRSFDYMVVHSHPFDAVPTLAVSESGPTVMKLDNADHVFSIGMHGAHLILHTRNSAAQLAIGRRGIDHSSGFVLPIPLDPAVRTKSRAEAKRILGLPDDDVLMLSVASAYKFSPYADLDFIATHVEFLNRHKHTRLVVLGPSPTGVWKAAEEQTEGRFRARGYVYDPLHYLEACDIAVESFPVGSVTAVLEMASYGNPIVSLKYAQTEEAQIYRTDDPGLEQLIFARDRESYQAALDDLVKNPARRHAIGDETAENLARFHQDAGWRETVERAYVIAKSKRPAKLTATLWRDDEIDLLAAGIHESCGFSRSMRNIRHSHIGTFPLADRVRAFRSERISASTFKGLLPDWLRGYLSRLSRATW